MFFIDLLSVLFEDFLIVPTLSKHLSQNKALMTMSTERLPTFKPSAKCCRTSSMPSHSASSSQSYSSILLPVEVKGFEIQQRRT